MKSGQKKHKKQVSTEQSNNKKKPIEISNEKTNLEKQVITLKHLNIQPNKQMMSSKEQAEKENVGIVIGQQDETPGKVGNRQTVTGKEKQMGGSKICNRMHMENNEGKLRELIKQDGGLRKLEIRKIAEGKEGNVGNKGHKGSSYQNN